MAQKPPDKKPSFDSTGFEDSGARLERIKTANRPAEPAKSKPKPAPKPAPSQRPFPVFGPSQPMGAPNPLLSLTGSSAAELEKKKAEENLKAFEKKQLNSEWDKSNRQQLNAVLGKVATPAAEDDAPEPELPAPGTYDGDTAAPECTSKDPWRAVHAPVQSKEGRRSPELYALAIDQFAVGSNPRYEPDAPDRPRGHIFVWDLTLAMHAEVPHFLGAKELNLAQTCDWVRHEGPVRGWHKTDARSATQYANEGKPVLVMPKDIKLKLIGVVRPGELGPDGKPRIAAAAKRRGKNLSTQEALGVFAVDYFYHP